MSLCECADHTTLHTQMHTHVDTHTRTDTLISPLSCITYPILTPLCSPTLHHFPDRVRVISPSLRQPWCWRWGRGCAQLTWAQRHHNAEYGVTERWCIDPTPVCSCITLCKVLQGHCEGEVCTMVPDGHMALSHFSVCRFGLHNLPHTSVFAPVFGILSEFVLVPTLHTQGSPHSARCGVGATQR